MTKDERQLRTALLAQAWCRPIIGLTIPARILHEAVTEVHRAYPEASDQRAWCEDVMELLAAAILSAWDQAPAAKQRAGIIMQGQVKSYLLRDCYAAPGKRGRPAIVIAGAGFFMLSDLVDRGDVVVWDDTPGAKALDMLAEAIPQHPDWPQMERSARRLGRSWIAECESLGLYQPQKVTP